MDLHPPFVYGMAGSLSGGGGIEWPGACASRPPNLIMEMLSRNTKKLSFNFVLFCLVGFKCEKHLPSST